MGQETFAVKARTSEELLSEVASQLSDKARSLWLHLEKERKEGGLSGLDSILRSELDQLKEKVRAELEIARRELGG